MKYLHRLLLCILLVCVPLTSQARLRGAAKLDSLKRALAAMPMDTNRAHLLAVMGFQCQFSNPPEGLDYARQGRSLSCKLGWQHGVAISQNVFGVYYMMTGDARNALLYFDSSYRINIRTGYLKDAADNLGNMGLVYSDLGDGPKAVDYLLQALKLFEQIGHKRGVTQQLMNLATVYGEMGNYKRSYYYDSVALATGASTLDSNGLATLIMNIGAIHFRLEKNTKSRIYFDQALGIYSRMGYKYGMANVLGNMGRMYYEAGVYDSVLSYFTKAGKMHEEVNDEHGMGICENSISNYYLTLFRKLHTRGGAPANLLNNALAHAQKAVAINARINHRENEGVTYKTLSECQEALGDYRQALSSFRLHIAIKDSLHSIENQKKIANLESVRQVELKEGKIQLLQRDINVKNLRATRDRLVRNLALVGVVLVLVIGASVTLYFVRKRRTEKLIADERINTLLKEQELASATNMLEAQEEERKRIAADLHDRLGSMLSTVKLYFNSVEEQIEALQRQSREQYGQATRLLDEACDEVRKISHNLAASDLARFGLVPSLNLMRDTISKTGRLKMEVHAWGLEERLDNKLEIGLYRIVQELMNNILKHARATEVTIEVNRVANSLNMIVSDNGVGFDVATAMEKGGIGLRNMQTRVKQLGGKITFDSVPGKGSTSIIEIDLVQPLSLYSPPSA